MIGTSSNPFMIHVDSDERRAKRSVLWFPKEEIKNIMHGFSVNHSFPNEYSL